MEQLNSISVPQFCTRNGVSKAFAYGEMRAGRLRSMLAGGRRLISLEAEREWVAACEEAARAKLDAEEV